MTWGAWYTDAMGLDPRIRRKLPWRDRTRCILLLAGYGQHLGPIAHGKPER